MDGSAKEIILDKDGVCNFCHIAQKELKMAEVEKKYLLRRIHEIKSNACTCGVPLEVLQNHKKNCGRYKYDCLIGLSGGVDSATVLHHAVRLRLKPLCFTMDNGYNDPKADENILRLVESLKVPLYRYVLDLDKFRDVQSAYLKAGVVNVEAVYDHLLMGATYEMAEKYGIKWVLSGGNVASESIMPASWSFSARDLVNMKSIYKWATGKKLKASKNFPLCSLLKFNWYKWVRGIKVFYLLDYV